MKGIAHKYKNVDIIHETESISIIQDIIKKFNPKLLIEFGTASAGFTFIVHEVNREMEIHTYDINKSKGIKKKEYNKNVHFYIQDILTIPSIEIIKLCKDNKKKLLYCDNGDKIKEVKIYSKYLNYGDMLGIHDWGKEINYKDISEELKEFAPIEENSLFERKGLMTRFWIKKRRNGMY